MTSPSTAEPERTTGSPSRSREDAERLLRRLSPREAQALARLAAGDDLRTLARNLGIAPGTARAHLNRAMRKLGARSHEEAAALAATLAVPTAADAPPEAGRPAPGAPPAADSPSAAGPGRKDRERPGSREPAAPTDRPGAPGHSPAAQPPDTPPTAGSRPEQGAPDRGRQPAPRPAEPTQPGPRPAEPTQPAQPPQPDPGVAADDPRPAAFADFAALVHTRLVQQTFLLTGHRHRAAHCVHLALGAAGRRWDEVAAAPDPEGRVRSAAFDLALSPWHRDGPRRTGALYRRRRIKVAEQTDPEPPERLTPHDRALLKALQRLSRPRRRALVLHDTLGLPVERVALEAESSRAAAEARVRSARESLAREVPSLVGADPDAAGFGERLGELLHRAAVHGCPGPRLPSPALLVADSRLHTGLPTGAAAALTVGVAVAVATTLFGVGPAELVRPEVPEATACTGTGSGSAGPAAEDGAPGLQTPWCGPTPGVPARLVGPPGRVLPPVGPAGSTGGADGARVLPAGPFDARRPPIVPLSARRPLPPPLAVACVPFERCRPPGA
ncbi:LuxR C-terminal-related transcriptional regulator [Kitasatospora sp. NPDC059646]|uniref:LuxR C-terminal-related transcriptional regulator n=1 Tax=Kitasatospora sp. NPDC059646 TaxID=3346893 RepID=UPI0036971E70